MRFACDDRISIFFCEVIIFGAWGQQGGLQCTQTPQASWSAGGCRERLWVMELLSQESNFFHCPRVSPGDHPLTKKCKDSAYEIGRTGDRIRNLYFLYLQNL